MPTELELSQSVLLGQVYQTRRRALLNRVDALIERAIAALDNELASQLDAVRADLEAAGIKDLRCGLRLYQRWMDRAEQQLPAVA